MRDDEIRVAPGSSVAAGAISVTWTPSWVPHMRATWSALRRCTLCNGTAPTDESWYQLASGLPVCAWCQYTVLPCVRAWHGLEPDEELTVLDAWEWASVFQFGEGAEVMAERAVAVEFLRRRLAA